MTKNNKNKAFTLLELSIVILVIGLLVGGIVGSTQMIYQAKIKKFINEIENYKIVTNVFKDKYGAFPGDFEKASALWGCTAGTVPVGCNGWNDRYIAPPWAGYLSPVGEGHEPLRAWQHLSLAGLVPDKYTGITTVANQYDLGINVAGSKAFENGGFFLQSDRFWGYTETKQAILFFFGGFQANSYNGAEALLASDLKQVDDKIDDGKPRSGEVMGSPGGNCISGTAYNSASNVIGCQAAFVVELN